MPSSKLPIKGRHQSVCVCVYNILHTWSHLEMDGRCDALAHNIEKRTQSSRPQSTCKANRGEKNIHTHATTTWLKFEFHARCSCAHQTNQSKNTRRRRRRREKAVLCTQCRTLVHWTSWKQWQIRLCLHQRLQNACEVNLGNLGSHVHCFQCKMWPLIALFRDIFSSSSLCPLARLFSLPLLQAIWNRFGSVAQLFVESTYFDPVSMFIILDTKHATKVAFIKRLEKCILFLYIYYWCYRQMAATIKLVIRFFCLNPKEKLMKIKP